MRRTYKTLTIAFLSILLLAAPFIENLDIGIAKNQNSTEEVTNKVVNENENNINDLNVSEENEGLVDENNYANETEEELNNTEANTVENEANETVVEEAEKNNEKVIQEEKTGAVKLFLTNEEGDELDGNIYPQRMIDRDSNINLNIHWDLTNAELNQTYLLSLPAELKIFKEQSGILIAGDSEVGTYSVSTDGQVKVIVDENQVPDTGAKGSIAIKTKLNEEKIDEKDSVSLTFSLGNKSKTIVVPLKVELDDEDIMVELSEGVKITKNSEDGEHDSAGNKSKKEEQAKVVVDENTQPREPKSIPNTKAKSFTTMKDDTQAITIEQKYINKESDGSNKTKYFIDEDIVYNVDLSVSGNETILTNHVIKIEFPSEHVDNEWSLTKPDSASEVRYETEGEKKVAYITFPTLTGGTELSFPVRLKFKANINGSTVPEGYTLNIGATLLDEAGAIVKEANQIHFEAKYEDLNFTKELNGSNRNGQNIFGGMTADGKIIADETVEVPFNFKVSGMINYPKSRGFSEATIVDTLPPHAKFDPERNPGWELSSDGKTISKTFEGNTNQQLRNAIVNDQLWLTFPGAEINTTYTNTAEISLEQRNKEDYEPNYKLKDDISYVLDGEVTGDFFYKYAMTDAKEIYDSTSGKEKLQRWNIRLDNPTRMELQDIVIDDYELDERMECEYVESISNAYFKDSQVEIIAIVGENETEQALNEVDGKYVFPENTKSFKVKVDKLAPYTSTQFLYFYTKLKDPDTVHYDSEDTSRNLFYNYAKMDANAVVPNKPDSKTTIKVSDNDRYTLVQINEKVKIQKRLAYPKAQYMEGDNISFYLIFEPSRDVQPDRVFKNAKFIDLLPDGLTPEEHSTYTIAENYKNSGRTAVIYELGDLQGNSSVGKLLNATVNKLSGEGLNTNELYFTYEGEQLPIDGNNKGPDEYDLYGDGDTTKEINYATADYNYLSAKEVVSRKYVQNDGENNWTTNGITTDEKEAFQYRLNVNNYLDNDVENLILYEVLPYDGDKAIVKNDAGERIARESVFGNILTGEVEGPEGFTIYYSTDEVSEDEKDAVNNGNWQTSVSDYSQVTAIKIEMNEDRVLESKEEIDFILPMQAPKKWALDTGDRAYNSFAISTNNGQSFVEANKVYNEINVSERITKDVEGDIHLDIDREKEYKYNVITQIPEDIQDYEKFIISDEVDPGLSIMTEGVKATVDGQAYDGLTVNVDENNVSVTVDDFGGLAGKQQIELVIPAKINIDTNINAYPDGNIPNTATVYFKHKDNEESAKETDPVTVTPEDPSIVKDVNGKEHIFIDREKEYIYNVVTALPNDIKDYTKFVITDEVDVGLSVNESGVKATVDGEDYAGLEVSVDGNKVTVSVTDIAGLAGKGQVELVIPAIIKENTDISKYADKKIPNIAELDFTNASGEDKQKRTEPVTVTPPEPPVVEKDVEGKDHLEIEKGKEYNYNVTTQIPTDLGGYEYLTLSDTLDNRLEVVKATVLVDDKASDFEAEVIVQGVTLTFNRKEFDRIAEKEINEKFKVKIKPEVTIKKTKKKEKIN